jgi:ribosomal protein S18 acetylase RimI-like enzyme
MWYTLRPATEADRDVLYHLHAATIKEYVEQIWGWDDAFQEARFHQRFDPDVCQVIVVDGEDVGVLQVERREGEVFLGNIRIAPDRQRRGLGTAVIRDVLAQAACDGLPVALQVLKGNPAKGLYERLGFAVVKETATHYVMLKE